MNQREAGAYFELGKSCRGQGRWPEADAALKKALEFNPENGWIRIEMGTLYLDQDKLSEAAIEFKKAIAMGRNDSGVHCQLGRIYHRQGQWPEAEASLHKALELDPKNGGARMELGALYEDQSRFAEAAAELEGGFAIEPNNSGTHCEFGRISRKQERWAEAEAALRKALELDPRSGTHCQLGRIYRRQGRSSEAEAALHRAIELDPQNGCAHVELGTLYEDQRKFIQATEEFESAVAVEPNNGGAHCQLGRKYRRQMRWREAEAALRKALELDPRNDGARMELCALYQDRDRFSEAEAEYEKAIAIDPRNGEAHLELGNVCRRQGRWREAEAEFEEAIASDRANDRAYVGLWAIYRSQERWPEARAALSKAMEINPNSAFAATAWPERRDLDQAIGKDADSAGSCAGADDRNASMRERVFCLLPWTHLHILTDGSCHPCATWSGPLLGNARSSSFSELWNSPGLKALRSDMMCGRAVAGCQRCYQDEHSGFWSMRQRKNNDLARHRGREQLTAPDGTLPRLPVPLLDLRFSNACNLRCRICNPMKSSAWAADARALGSPTEGGAIRKFYDDWDSLWRQLRPLLEEGLEEIFFAGGEPLIMEEHYRILDFLIKRGLTDVRLNYVTNFSTLRFLGRDVIDLWSRFRNVQVTASLDGSGRRGEYLRKGLNWDAVVANREEMLRRCPDVVFGVSATLSIFNALHLPDFHREWVESGYINRNGFTLPMLEEPAIYRMQVLPLTLKERVLEAYRRHQESFMDAEGTTARNFAAAARFLQAQDRSELLPEFVAMTRRLDRMRGEDCREVFPELAALFEASA